MKWLLNDRKLWRVLVGGNTWRGWRPWWQNRVTPPHTRAPNNTHDSNRMSTITTIHSKSSKSHHQDHLAPRSCKQQQHILSLKSLVENYLTTKQQQKSSLYNFSPCEDRTCVVQVARVGENSTTTITTNTAQDKRQQTADT